MMTKRLVPALVLLAGLPACDRAEETPPPAPSPTASARSGPIAFDPALVGVSGSWRSRSDALGAGRLLQIDVASGGRYSIDVRLPGTPEQVVETGRGVVSLSRGLVSARPDAGTRGKVLTALGDWTARVDVSARTMTLLGADRKSVTLASRP